MRKVQQGHFYFLKDVYYERFNDGTLMENKESIGGEKHGRPCFFAFEYDGFLWMIPISSKVGKYKAIAERKIERYGRCDTILFCEVLGHEKAFLIQNMCPAFPLYVGEEYIDKASNIPVRVDGRFEVKLIKTAKKVLEKQKHGVRILFTDVETIKANLTKKVSAENPNHKLMTPLERQQREIQLRYEMERGKYLQQLIEDGSIIIEEGEKGSHN